MLVCLKKLDRITMLKSMQIWWLSLNHALHLFLPRKYPPRLIRVLVKILWDPLLTTLKQNKLRWGIPILISSRARSRGRSLSQTGQEKIICQAKKTQAQVNMTSRTLVTKRTSMLRVSMPFSYQRCPTARTQRLRISRILVLVFTKRNIHPEMQALL